MTWQLVSTRARRQEGQAEALLLMTIASESHSTTSTIFYCLELSYEVWLTLKGREIRFHILKGGVLNNLKTYLKTTT